MWAGVIIEWVGCLTTGKFDPIWSLKPYRRGLKLVTGAGLQISLIHNYSLTK